MSYGFLLSHPEKRSFPLELAPRPRRLFDIWQIIWKLKQRNLRSKNKSRLPKSAAMIGGDADQDLAIDMKSELRVPRNAPFKLIAIQGGVQILPSTNVILFHQTYDNFHHLAKQEPLLPGTIILTLDKVYLFKTKGNGNVNSIINTIQKHHCPISLERLQISNPQVNKTVQSNPWFYTGCGYPILTRHVFGYHDYLLKIRACPLCRTCGQYRPLKMHALLDVVPDSVIVPCGHMIAKSEMQDWFRAGEIDLNCQLLPIKEKCLYCLKHIEAVRPLYYS